ncbi:MAG: ATP-grasp domain-containing protein [Armatimonadota bacterium]|nr:ATP-grasp domain-containing protein [Armatimonadota bacterium]
MTDALSLLFLGAGKRLSLFERVAGACRREGVRPRLHSYEDTATVPVASAATVTVGLRWDDPAFGEHVLEVVRRHRIGVVIPCMDGATVALARVAPALAEEGCWAVVSDIDLCRVFDDKRLMERWFLDHGVTTPIWRPDAPLPWIVKHIHGFGSRRQFVVRTHAEFERMTADIDLGDYVVQPLLDGPEFTIDAYVSRAGEVLGCVTRRRLQVVDGEVVQSVTERQPSLVAETTRILGLGGFRGPVTFQAIRHADRFWFVEGNLRFGGGVILSMEAGADYARLLVREALGRPVAPVVWREGVLMTRAYREVFHEGYVYGHHG